MPSPVESEQARIEAQETQRQAGEAPVPQPGESTAPRPEGAPVPQATLPQDIVTGAEAPTREAALALTPRIEIDTPSLKGSIILRGGRIDDLLLTDYHETVEPDEPAHRAVLAVGQRASLLRRFRLGRPAGDGVPTAGPRHDVDRRRRAAGAGRT